MTAISELRDENRRLIAGLTRIAIRCAELDQPEISRIASAIANSDWKLLGGADVRDFGAKADGVTDDAEARRLRQALLDVRAALAQAEASGPLNYHGTTALRTAEQIIAEALDVGGEA